ncbi:MAG: voltage-dependent potassium channel subunit beta [Cytophagales bacterium]|nr:MAG: voltage-dependent potassium channel subunit beta [Cytophagales bacterium]TAF61659.1 MAG: voltage-dependent potassium channel subunit beta [Cytophagales bacterium]
MEYRRLGKSGLQVSALSFGSWVTFGKQIGESEAEKLMHLAYDAGVNFFDNAEVYARGQSEIIMGNILKKSGWQRDSFLVSSKVFWGGDKPNQKGLSRKRVVEACHAALKRLQVDYLDLYFCHRPDLNTPIEETVRAMSDLVTQGKILYWGTSEWSAQEIQAAYSAARQYNLIPPTMEQPQYNMFHRERVEVEYSRLYEDIGLGTTIWSPLASGLLTGKYNSGIAPKDSRAEIEGMGWLKEKLVGEEAKLKVEKVGILTEIASELGLSLPQLALAWVLKNPNVSTALTGASKPTQVIENMKAVLVLSKLTNEVMEAVEEVLANKPQIMIF